MATSNKGFLTPANGADVDDWDVPVNANWNAIDSAFGGVTFLNVTSVTSTPVVLTLTQYTPPIIKITGTLTANVTYQMPSGVGGFWSIFNNSTGAFTVTFASLGGGTSLVLPQGYTTATVCDGTNVGYFTTAILPTRQVFLSGTGATYTTPPNCRQIRVTIVAGGAAGESPDGTPGSFVDGGLGGTSSFNSVTAQGGRNGLGWRPGPPTSGGSGTASVRQQGSPGGPGNNGSWNFNLVAYGGNGGVSSQGGGGFGGPSNFGANPGGAAVANSGSGGGGGYFNSTSDGGAGGGAGETVYLIIDSPASTYTYTVGPGGSVGSGGVGANGGAGGSGIIIVDEIY